MSTPRPRNARAEATELLNRGSEPDRYEARVLEPSPPADISDPTYRAEDPTDPADQPDPTDPSDAEHTVVSPTSDGDLTWEEIAMRDAQVAEFARVHWLGPRRRLTTLPHAFDSTRQAVHQLAFHALAPARHQHTGRLGLRYTRGGLGTPFHPTDRGDQQFRIDGSYLIVQTGDEVQWCEPSTLLEACNLLDVEYRPDWFEDFADPLPAIGPDAELTLHAEAVWALGDWFGFATAVLEELRRTDGAQDVSRVQLWPEHLDPAVELGSRDAGQRASYGASPGDDDHDEPYLYVSPWSGRGDSAQDGYWNDDAFGGASLSYADLLGTDDQYGVALAFLRQGHALLTGATG